MKVTNLISLFLSILFLLLSSWMFTTFYRLDKLSKKCENDKELESKCSLSYTYIKTGYIMSTISVIFAIITMVILSINLYINI